ncbi:hypothetical protein [Pseudomonas sp. TH49]|uniref:hypothetical protein n=1 Tax=Pseudomonas sp. TH49 TaxID=2796413 RepID=UPI001F5BE4FE|nr:hypothetical protein [Pseudomonas sp. TH49]
MSQTTPSSADQKDDELARNAALFFEADRLEAYAYSLIEGDSTSALSWERFTEAKGLADAKRSEAQQDLLRIRGQSSTAAPTEPSSEASGPKSPGE